MVDVSAHSILANIDSLVTLPGKSLLSRKNGDSKEVNSASKSKWLLTQPVISDRLLVAATVQLAIAIAMVAY